MKPKVFVAGIFYEAKGYCLFEYLSKLKELNYEDKEFFFVDNSENPKFLDLVKGQVKDKLDWDLPAVRIPFVKTTRMRQVASYNLVFQKFRESDCDYLLIVESDLFPHKYTIELLMEHDVDSVSAVYWLGTGKKKSPCWTTDIFNLMPNPMTKKPTFGSVFESNQAINGTLQRVYGGYGFGCCLLKRKVIETVKKVRHGDLHADTYFHEDMDMMGFDEWMDTRVVVEHRPSEYPSDDW